MVYCIYSVESKCAKYVHVVSDLLKRISFHIKIMIYISGFFYFDVLLPSNIKGYQYHHTPVIATDSLTLGRHNLHNVKPFLPQLLSIIPAAETVDMH